MSLKHDSGADGSGSSSGEWDGLASPDVLRKYREPKWYMERGAQTDDDGFAGPYRGLGIPHRLVRGQAAATTQRAGARARRSYRPRRCGLCYHEHVFDTRTGLNNHASQQHGYYYSLKEDCFLPLGLSGVRRDVPRRPPPSAAASAQDWMRASAAEPDVPWGASGPCTPEVSHRSVMREGSTTASWLRKRRARVS